MADEDAFLAAIAADPAADTPRLVYADWLDDHADPRAEYVRLEVERHQLHPKLGALRAELTARLERLRSLVDSHWLPRIDRVNRISIYWPRDECASAEVRQNLGQPLNQTSVGYPPGPLRSVAGSGDYLYAVSFRKSVLRLVARMRLIRQVDYYLEVCECTPIRPYRAVPVEVLRRVRWVSGSTERVAVITDDGEVTPPDQLTRPRLLTSATAADFDSLIRDG